MLPLRPGGLAEKARSSQGRSGSRPCQPEAPPRQAASAALAEDTANVLLRRGGAEEACNSLCTWLRLSPSSSAAWTTLRRWSRIVWINFEAMQFFMRHGGQTGHQDSDPSWSRPGRRSSSLRSTLTLIRTSRGETVASL